MNRLLAALYDPLTAPTEEACLSAWRREILQDVEGRVLELGAGTGRNLDHLPRGLERLVLVEPDPHMRSRLRRKLGRGVGRRRVARSPSVGARAEHLPFPDGAFDVVVATLVLCSVSDLSRTLAEVKRVLRPAGELRFLEHVAAEPGSRRLRWQRRLEPVWSRLAGNCHLARHTLERIQEAGFQVTDVRREPMRRAPPILRPTIRGRAVAG